MILITGASGHLGRAVTSHLLDMLPDPSRLLLGTRNPEGFAAPVPGSQVRRVDFDEPESLAHAFDGVDRLLLISTDTVHTRADQHAAAIDAAKASGVRHIVYTSMLSPGPDNPALISDSHWATEQYLRSSGIGWTILRFGLYADFQAFEAADAVAGGRFVHNRGSSGCSYIARDDCALAAATVLANPGHDGALYEITGPESLNAVDLARLYSQTGSRDVVAEDVSDDELLRHIGGEPSSEGHVQYGPALMVSLGKATREGHFDTVTDVFHDLTSRRPTTVRQILLDKG